MKPFLYVTDLHGHGGKYERVFSYAKQTGAGLVINGGDICPSGHRHEDQKRFYEDFLAPHLARYQEAGIRYLTLTGNDDLEALDALLDGICAKAPLATHISRRMVEFEGFFFIGLDRVTDFPFRLKDRARKDSAAYVFGSQFGRAALSTPEGFREIPDWPAYAGTIPTMEQELDALPAPPDPARAVYVLHGPPSGAGLDRVRNGGNVGSPATRAFLGRVQPLLSLHGHIHESPEESGVWKTKIGRTVCIQPGQSAEDLTVVAGSLDGMSFERKLLPVR